jgi:shikimate dehydrogenase
MTPPLLGVLGHPVAHSRSPAMMGAALAELGLDWRYLPLPVPPELFEETARALPGSGFRGANVTLPHKLSALQLADVASSAAREIGAANTLTFTGDGSIEADNTDAGGLLDALPAPPAGRRALVLGAGGAGRAAVWALRGAGAEVRVWNRTPERARELAAGLGVGVADDPAAFATDLLVNATAVGLGSAEGGARREGLPLDRLEPPAVVVDLAYGPGETPTCAWAREAGATVVDGLEILVRQGARSLAIWTAAEPPLDVMRAAAGGTG